MKNLSADSPFTITSSVERRHLKFERPDSSRVSASTFTLSELEQIRLFHDAEAAWHVGQQFARDHVRLTGAALYTFSEALAISHGWRFRAHPDFGFTGSISSTRKKC